MQRRLKAAAQRSDLRPKQQLNDDLPEIEARLLKQAVLGRKTLDECIAAIEARLIAQALERADGNQAKAAALLGLRPNTLHYKIQRYGLNERRKRSSPN